MRIIDRFKKNNFVKRFTYIFFSSYILLFFSEYFFLNEGPTFELISTLKENPLGLFFILEFILFYVFCAYAFFIAVDKFNVRNFWSIFLAASLFGWWTEGTIIPIIYMEFPLAIVWPSIGWHVLVDVMLGYIFVRKILNQNNYIKTTLLSSGLGLFWGVWATWFWSEGTKAIIPFNFMLFSFFSSVLLTFSYFMIDKIKLKELNISKTEIIIFIILSIALLLIQSISFGILPLITILPLTAIVLLTLKKNNKIETKPNIVQDLNGNVKTLNYLILFLIPVIASITYYFIYSYNLNLNITNEIPPLLMILGLLMFIISFIKIIFKKT